MGFLVDTVLMKEEKCLITGVCIEGNIEVGEECYRAYKRIKERDLDLVQNGDIRDISLKLHMIMAYNHSIDHLPEGMSGEIHLTGIGGDKIRVKDTLCFRKYDRSVIG